MNIDYTKKLDQLIDMGEDLRTPEEEEYLDGLKKIADEEMKFYDELNNRAVGYCYAHSGVVKRRVIKSSDMKCRSFRIGSMCPVCHDVEIWILNEEVIIKYCNDCKIKNDCIHYDDTVKYKQCVYQIEELLEEEDE